MCLKAELHVHMLLLVSAECIHLQLPKRVRICLST